LKQAEVTKNDAIKALLNNVKVINVGIDGFYESLRDQEVPCVHVIWSPPAGGNDEVINILDKLL